MTSLFDLNNKMIDKLSRRYRVDIGEMTLNEVKDLVTEHEWILFALTIKHPTMPYREIIKLARKEEMKRTPVNNVSDISEGVQH